MAASLVATAVDLGSFALFNFWVFRAYAQQPFTFWLVDYSVANGGLCAFLAFALSFALSQTVNFFVQRKATFKANNNPLLSGIMYAVMVVAVYALQLYLPTLIRVPIISRIGETWGDLLLKMINMTVSMLIQFPMLKFVIMRKKPAENSPQQNA
jgi:putative flippase GtrA